MKPWRRTDAKTFERQYPGGSVGRIVGPVPRLDGRGLEFVAMLGSVRLAECDDLADAAEFVDLVWQSRRKGREVR